MINNLKTPGVYINEISSLPPSIASVSTAIPAFIGYTERTIYKGKDLQYEPQKITSMVEYRQYFGGSQKEEDLNIEIIEQSSPRDITVRVGFKAPPAGKKSRHLMYYALQHYFANGGGPCYIVSVGTYTAFGSPIPSGSDTTGLEKGLKEIEKIDEVTLILFPEAQGLTDASAYYKLANLSLAQCGVLKDRFALIEVYHTNFDPALSSINGDGVGTNPTGIRTGINSDQVKYGAVYYPNLETNLTYDYKEDIKISSHSLDGAAVPAANTLKGKTISEIENLNNEAYQKIKLALTQLYVELPPGPSMAGIYARVDRNRGVWKAPANVGVQNVIKPVILLTDQQHGELNVDSNSGKSINAIRSFSGKGTIVRGARTLAGNDNEWRYVSVRRFFNMVEESTKNATEQFLFESNDANTWVKVKSMIENYLTLQWRAGALQGATPEEAFYVKVGLGETMTPIDILEGRLIVEIGMAAVRPAEFIILSFVHKIVES
ncbi:MAG: phage tail sheath family protein [Bacteroidetes bacterium]|nr:MAG: phage tail sheath family protein [Bacteroidota bacterium]